MEWSFRLDEDGLKIWRVSENAGDTPSFVKTITMKDFRPGSDVVQECISDSFEAERFLRAAMQAAWDMGIRPKGSLSPDDEAANAMAAMQSLASSLADEQAAHAKTKEQYLADLSLVIRSRFA